MAPEQFQGRALFASDIYSIGVIMYEMMTGVCPTSASIPVSWKRWPFRDALVRPRERNRAIPTEIEEIILKALAPEVP